MTAGETGRGRNRHRRIAISTALALLIALLAAVAWVGIRGYMAKSELEALVPLTETVKTAVTDGDTAALSQVSTELADHASKAASLTGDPIWRAMEVLPWIGPNLAAARVASSELDSLARDVVNPVVSLAVSVKGSVSSSTGMDLGALSASAPALAVAVATLDSASEHLTSVDTAAVVAPLASGIQQLSDAVGLTLPPMRALAQASQILPPLLGENGPRTVLLMLQNNAELRTGGGATGSFAELRVDHGTVTLVSQLDSSAFSPTETALLPVPTSTTALYGEVVGRYVQNVTMTADFDLSARLASTWWANRTGSTVDAVISIDPVVLSSLLSVIGEVTLENGTTLDANNVVTRLLVDPYVNLTTDSAQNALFGDAMTRIFAKTVTAASDPVQLIKALAAPIEQGRISVWSAHSEEQNVLKSTALGGAAARQQAAGDSAFAVYLNDATGSKMDSFLDVAITNGVQECRSDGRNDVVISVRLTSTAPADAATSLPGRMTGEGMWGTPAGDIATITSVSAPAGSYFGGVTVDGTPVASSDQNDLGYSVSATTVTLAPGESKTISYRFIAAQPGTMNPVILHTPLLNDVAITSATPSCG